MRSPASESTSQRKPSMQSSANTMTVIAGARSSPLSIAQVQEVQRELESRHNGILLEPLLLTTIGDRDQKTSLRTLEKTDFFTRDIDASLLEGRCRIAVHSAKDLPDPLPKGIAIAALTQGVDSSDSLVLRKGETLGALPSGAKIATSSFRREDSVRQLRADLSFIDVRGPIQQRLSLLDRGVADGVVIAEAALIRLGLAHLHRITLPGETTPYQGQLAIAVRDGDTEMEELFSSLDIRPIELHIGLSAPANQSLEYRVVHQPLIETSPLQNPLPSLEGITHAIFGSKSAVHYLFEKISPETLKGKTVIAVGQSTAAVLMKSGIEPLVAAEETSEGICTLLDSISFKAGSKVFWPHSALSRDVIKDYLECKGISRVEWVAYTTKCRTPENPFPLSKVKTVRFTSPSTIDAFLYCYGALPDTIHYSSIGPVTEAYFKKKQGEDIPNFEFT